MNLFLTVLRNVFLGGNVSSLSLISKPREMVHYVSETLFLQRQFTRYGLPHKNVADVFMLDSQEIRLLSLRDSWFNIVPSYLSDLVNLCLLAQCSKAKVIFEIGTFQGYTALHFAANSKADVFTLDLPPDGWGTLKTTAMDRDHVRARHQVETKPLWTGHPEASRIHQLYGDSANFDFSPWSGKVDLFFIDGAHSYEYVRSDTFKALQCCHPGSLIAWHDYGRVGLNGVTRWLHEFAKDRKVYRAPGGSLAFCISS